MNHSYINFVHLYFVVSLGNNDMTIAMMFIPISSIYEGITILKKTET